MKCPRPNMKNCLTHVRGVDGLLSALTEQIDAEVMEAAPNLKVISNFAVGVDNIDVARGYGAQNPSRKYARRTDRCNGRHGLCVASGGRPANC